MTKKARTMALGLAIAVLALSTPAWARPETIVAAESFYGDVARQVAGPDVAVTSILANPDQDPHLFEASVSAARAIAAARIVIYSGLDYDVWMERLVAAATVPGRTVLVAAELSGRKPGDNPHIWYDPATMRAVARAVAAALIADDPAHAPDYRARLAGFEASLAPLDARIAALRARVAGMTVTATEPVAGDMFRALGLTVRNTSFQRAVMNSAEPGASEVAAFETSLRGRQVRLLLFNSQATNPLADRMVRIARVSSVPVLAMTESEPPGVPYQAWIGGWLDALDLSLGAAP